MNDELTTYAVAGIALISVEVLNSWVAFVVGVFSAFYIALKVIRMLKDWNKPKS